MNITLFDFKKNWLKTIQFYIGTRLWVKAFDWIPQVEETDKVIAEIETVSQQYLPLSQVSVIYVRDKCLKKVQSKILAVHNFYLSITFILLVLHTPKEKICLKIDKQYVFVCYIWVNPIPKQKLSTLTK